VGRVSRTEQAFNGPDQHSRIGDAAIDSSAGHGVGTGRESSSTPPELQRVLFCSAGILDL
jgi:hypothetical protein